MSEADMDPAEISLADDDVRYVPTEGSGGDFCGLAHESRYRWVIDHLNLQGKWVLDFGCGSGYGSSALARDAGVVHGLDYSPQAIAYAATRFAAPNTRFMAADATSEEEVYSRFGKRSYDVVVSFDVIEHIGQYRTYLAILAELIMKDGVLAIGCPNRLQTLNWNRDWNRCHAQEFSPAEFRSLLAEFFTDVTLYSQDFHNSQTREQVRQRNYGSEPPLPPMALLPDDIAITAEPPAEQLESAFGIMAVCRGVREAAARPVVAHRRCRVLLFEPQYGYEEALPWIPIGKGYLAAVVREHGFDVRIVDNALRAHTDVELTAIPCASPG
jgi:SAM-dependent methyltransferase